MLASALGDGGERIQVKACGTCMKERGLVEEDFIDGVKRGTMHDMVDFVASCDRNVVF